jgi:hypothetical protein
MTGRWEPCDRRRSSTVLREPGGETPPGYSLGAHVAGQHSSRVGYACGHHAGSRQGGSGARRWSKRVLSVTRSSLVGGADAVRGRLRVPGLVRPQHRFLVGEFTVRPGREPVAGRSSSHTPQERKCWSRCGPPCPRLGQRLRRSSSISIACTASRASSRESRRGKQSATCAITFPNAAVHSCWAIVASTATTSCVVFTNGHDRGGRSPDCATPDLHRHVNDQDLQPPCRICHSAERACSRWRLYCMAAARGPLQAFGARRDGIGPDPGQFHA